MKIGIVGNGFVGKATKILQNPDVDVFVYDVRPELCEPKGLSLEDMDRMCELIFLCLPTPMKFDGSCDTSILQTVLKQLHNPYVIVRSTVPIGFCHSHHCFFMPEFLTELHWAKDFKENKTWVFGLVQGESKETEIRNLHFRERVQRVLALAHQHGKIDHGGPFFVLNTEAEMVKLIKNVFLACKVSFFNEIFDLSQKYGLDYETIMRIVRRDERIGPTHDRVPGYLGLRGYGGTCLPKDANNLLSLFQENHLYSEMIAASLYRNEYVDRRQRDWLSDQGRTLSRSILPVALIVHVGTHVDKLNKLVQDKLVGKNVIVYSDHDLPLPDHPRLSFRRGSYQSKLFFPKLDEVHLSMDDYHPKDLVLGLHLAELVLLHDCDLVYASHGDVWDKIFQEFPIKRRSQ